MTNFSKPVYIVDGSRTPFLKARGQRGPFSASDLAVSAGRDLLSRYAFSPEAIDEVVVGCMMPSEDEANIGRIIAMRLGCGDKVPGWTVQRNCASGMQALDSAIKDICIGRHDLVLAGGTEAMSRSPLLFKPDMVNWFARLNSAKTAMAKLSTLSQFKMKYLKPTIALLHGLTDPLCGYIMGQTTEQLAFDFDISRQEMDAFSLQSHNRLANAQDQNLFPEITTIYDHKGKFYQHDDGVRRGGTIEKLAKLRPNFDRKFGLVTPGNSSQVTDGAAMLLLASQDAINRYNLPVLGRVVDVEWAALDPRLMGLGPVVSSVPLLQRNQLGIDDIDYWEINEAFAGQLIACVKAMGDDQFCKQYFDLDEAFGTIDDNRLNIDGGAIGLGHPVGATGARIVLHLSHILQRKDAKYGVATLCIGGGQGGAMLIERV